MRARSTLVVLAVLAGSVAGCIDTPDGTVSVYVTAESGSSLREVQLNLSTVHVRPAGSSAENETDVLQADRFPENWVEVSMSPSAVAMTFNGSGPRTPVFFGEGPAPVDDYDGIGVVVEGAHAVDRNGTPVNVTVADEVTDIRANFSVDEGGETRLVLTVDLAQSLDRGEREAEGWVLTPHFADVAVAHPEDDASGQERHTPGRAANLSR